MIEYQSQKWAFSFGCGRKQEQWPVSASSSPNMTILHFRLLPSEISLWWRKNAQNDKCLKSCSKLAKKCLYHPFGGMLAWKVANKHPQNCRHFWRNLPHRQGQSCSGQVQVAPIPLAAEGRTCLTKCLPGEYRQVLQRYCLVWIGLDWLAGTGVATTLRIVQCSQPKPFLSTVKNLE